MTAPDREIYCEPQDAVSQKAAAYFTRRRDGDWGLADQAELDTWLRESTSHYVAWIRVERIFARANQLVSLDAVQSGQRASASRGWAGIRPLVLPLLAAASVTLFAALGIPYAISLMQPPDRTDSTDVGGRTLLSFSDRTQIELDTNTLMRIRMTTAERTVWLEKGEAWFHVAHDAAHPFTVVVGKHRITDLGTEFLVRRDENDVDVALVNGRAALNASGQQTATLNPGDEAVATLVSLSVTRKTPQQLADELSWRHGMLVFRDAPLSEVVREFNRYNAIKLVIADKSIAGKRIYASLRTDDFNGFVQLAEMELNLRVDRVGRTIVLSRGQQQATKGIVRLKHNP